MAASGIEADVGHALEDFMQKLRGLADSHVGATRVELTDRERALDEREQQLNVREHALEERARMLERLFKAESKFSQLSKDGSPNKVGEQVEEEVAKLFEVAAEQAVLKCTQPERPLSAALMVPSPTRANRSIPQAAQASSSACASDFARGNVPRQNLRAEPSLPLATSPRTSPPLQSSPAAATVNNQEAALSPRPWERNRRNGATIVEHKEKLLAAMGGGASLGSADDSAVNMSIFSAPGCGSAAPKQVRRSLAELLQEDELRLEQLRA